MTIPVQCGDSLPGLPRGLPDLDALLDRYDVPERGRQLVRDAFTGDPMRRVGGGSRNMVVRFASRKMGCVIQCESRTVERAFVGRCEHDPKIRLYLCQPCRLPIRVVGSDRRSRTSYSVVDYLVLHEDEGFMLVECKPESELLKHPTRFVRDGSAWRFPPLERAVADSGLKVWVYSSEDINPVWLRNVDFLDDFVDAECPDRALCAEVLERVRKARSIRVSTLLEAMGGCSEALWWLLANNQLAADLERELVFDLGWGWIHDSLERAIARRTVCAEHGLVGAPFNSGANVVRIEPGERVRWDGVPWRVLNRGADKVTLQRDDGTDNLVVLPLADVETLLERGGLLPDAKAQLDSMVAAREAIVLGTSNREIEAARVRYRALEAFRRDGAPPAGVSRRTIRRYERKADEGERRYGSAFIGLISRRGRSRGTPALLPSQREAVVKAVEKYREAGRAGSVTGAYGYLLDNWHDRALPAPSYETLRRAIRALPRSTEARERAGRRQAVQHEGPSPPFGYALPPHGDRVFAVGEIDHSPFDLQLVSAVTGVVLGTAYLSVLIDACTRTVLAFVLRFGAPRRMPVLELLHECVRRHGRVPDSLVVDQGPEFNSIDFERACAVLGISKVERAAARPRQGAVMERLFAVSNERMTHQLLGNTELNVLGRGLSPSHRPSRFARWTLARAHQACHDFFFDVYPNLVHGSLGAKPRDVFEHSMAVAGERVRWRVVGDLALRALLAETPKCGGTTRKVDGARGVFLGYLWYWHALFNHGDVAGTRVEVKVFPDECGEILARVRGQWRRCALVDGDYDFAGRSRHQIAMVIEELRTRHQIGRSRDTQRINAKAIGAFLARLGDTEAECAIKRRALLDRENADARASAPFTVAAPSRPRLAAVDGELTEPADEPPLQSTPAESSGADSAAVGSVDPDKLEVIDGW